MMRNQPASRLRQWILDMKIQKKLLVSFLILNLIPLAVIGTLTYQKSRSLIQEKTNAYTTDLLTEVSKNIEFKMKEVKRVYYSLFTNKEIRDALKKANLGFQSQLEYLDEINKIKLLLDGAIIDSEDIQDISLYALNKDVFPSGNVLKSNDLDIHDWDVLKENEGNLVWMNTNPKQLTITARSSMFDVGNLKKIGYFELHLKEDALYSVFAQTKLNNEGEMYIINQNGRIISHSNKSLINTTPDYPYINRVLHGPEQDHTSEMMDGINYIITYHAIGNTDWKIVSVIPDAKYSQTSIELKNWMFVIFIICIVVALLIAYFVSNSISKPIRQLSAMMKDVEKDRFDIQFNYNSRNEIGVMSRNFNRMIDRIHHLINTVYQEELLKQQSQLKYLMFQINPHFLFNTLETINWLARMNNVPEVGKLSKALGDLMREGIKGKEYIPLDKELDNVNKYVYIQHYRYGDKITISIDIDAMALPLLVPRFILQPLVENAIIHGMEMKIDQGLIDIRGFFEDDLFIITISDNGNGIEAERLAQIRENLQVTVDDSGMGIGLINVHQRVQLHYGKRFGLQIDSFIGQGTVITLTLPRKDEKRSADSTKK
ncbi:sensor histidine kinase [Paenibacillus sp. V4I5]|uniref:cache domain-containing sensor histidine kinase n=1 Tax=Paenibacillus sp. V4I5 TaxID=3042306 RepID=UPI00278FF0C3|nr:sensor histidine kinase [Paenibacillus sp. V4I5]MDQ0919878.1 two-component system sensor histidine kinase YesM [Paenibacillus sp. V4I5]